MSDHRLSEAPPCDGCGLPGAGGEMGHSSHEDCVGALIGMLREAQWASGGSWGPSGDDSEASGYSCYFCRGYRRDQPHGAIGVTKAGHQPDCKLAAVLRHSEEKT